MCKRFGAGVVGEHAQIDPVDEQLAPRPTDCCCQQQAAASLTTMRTCDAHAHVRAMQLRAEQPADEAEIPDELVLVEEPPGAARA